ncbi:hypothetical protein BGZ98_007611 [Dissophora globulifera]|nr:hypothetical protein BGZ98_007611 [Dissophora globulifera]
MADAVWVCDECEPARTFSSPEQQRAHALDVHAASFTIRVRGDSGSLENLVVRQVNGVYNCPTCGLPFRSKSGLRKHYNNIHESDTLLPTIAGAMQSPLSTIAAAQGKRPEHAEHLPIEKRLRSGAATGHDLQSSGALSTTVKSIASFTTLSSSAMPNPFLSESDAWKDFAYFTSFGQKATWTCVADGPSSVNYLSLFKEYQAAEKTSLALDMIADVSTNGSEPGTLTEWIKSRYGYEGLKSARLDAPILKSIG